MIGNNAFVGKDCELYALLENVGYTLKHIGLCTDFADFMSMQQSKVNLILHPCAKKAAAKMENHADIAFQLAFNTYDPEEIEAYYHALEEKLGVAFPDFTAHKERALKAIAKTHALVGSYPVVIDYHAVLKPFSLAKVLVQHGFTVKKIFCDEVSEFEKEKCEWLMEHVPELEIIQAQHPDSVKFEHEQPEVLSIGFSGGYLTKSLHVVDLMEDEHLYGFWGIEKLMEKIEYAFTHETDVNKIIEGANLVV
jgi:hypothetical protein